MELFSQFLRVVVFENPPAKVDDKKDSRAASVNVIWVSLD